MDAYQPIRSISLPSRLYPTCERFEAVSRHLKSNYNNNHIEADAIQNGLVGLAELYSCMEESLRNTHNQHVLLHYQKGKLVEEALQGSVTLLDACSTARDIVLILREHVQTLQSALRRRRSDASIESSIASYMSFRKKVKKDIAKQLVALKIMESTMNSYPPLDLEQQHSSDVARNLKEASSITISIFRCLLLYLTMAEMKAKKSPSLMAKLLPLRLFSCEKEHKIVNGVEGLSMALHSLINHSRSSHTKVEVKEIQGMLETLSINSEGLETALEGIFKSLVQHRVSLLNVITH